MRTVRLTLHVSHKSALDVYETLSNFEQYPELSDAVQSVAVTEVSDAVTISRWEIRFGAGLLRWTEEDHFDRDELTITFRQLEGDVAVFDGSWQCRAATSGCYIEFSARLDMGIPSLADALEPIAARTLIDNTLAIMNGLLGPTDLVASEIAVPTVPEVRS